jgi:hypothetical protein
MDENNIIYIYIYIEREREREGVKCKDLYVIIIFFLSPASFLRNLLLGVEA